MFFLERRTTSIKVKRVKYCVWKSSSLFPEQNKEYFNFVEIMTADDFFMPHF